MGIDPTQGFPITAAGRVADRLGEFERRLSALERGAAPGPFVGQIVAHALATAPLRHLACNGAAVSRETYSGLFSKIGTDYGIGDGSTTFNVPDIKGKVIAGIDNGQTEFDTRGETGGSKTHTLTVGQLPNHNHNFIGGLGGGANLRAQLGVNLADYGLGNVVYDTLETNGSAPAGGRGQAHNNLQPYIALHFAIYAGV